MKHAQRDGTEPETEPASELLLPLPGSVVEQFIKCGKATCRCMTSDFRHGPYSYRVWREGSEVHKVYIKKKDVARVRAACDAYRLIKHSSFVWQPVVSRNLKQDAGTNFLIAQELGRTAEELRLNTIELRRQAKALRAEAKKLREKNKERREEDASVQDADEV